MSISTLTSPVTGAPQTGLTTPTYTVVSDVAPDLYTSQWAVTALGGTQTGATAQTGADNPFNVSISRAKVLKPGPNVNSQNQIVGQPARNITKGSAKKGMRVNSASSVRFPAYFDWRLSVPAGSESVDPAEIRAMLSLVIGQLTQMSAGIGDTIVTGIK